MARLRASPCSLCDNVKLLIRRQESDVRFAWRCVYNRREPPSAARSTVVPSPAERPTTARARAERRVGRVRRTEIGHRAISAALGRLRAPDAELAPPVVVPPPDLVALRVDPRRDAIAGPFRASRDAALDAGQQIERVHLEGALVIGGVDHAFGRVAGPLRERESRRAIAPLPCRAAHAVRAIRRSHVPSVSV